MTVRRRPKSDDGVCAEAGDTLIEVLMALVIISLAVSALLGGLITAISTSGEHRSLSVEDTLLRSYAESVKYQLEFQSAQTPIFKECAVTADYAVPVSPPAGYSVRVNTIEYWNGTAFDSTCGANDATGVQLLTLVSTGPGATQTLSFVVRNPSDEPTE